MTGLWKMTSLQRKPVSSGHYPAFPSLFPGPHRVIGRVHDEIQGSLTLRPGSTHPSSPHQLPRGPPHCPLPYPLPIQVLVRGQGVFSGRCRQVPVAGRGPFPNHERILEVYLQGWVWRLKPLSTWEAEARRLL